MDGILHAKSQKTTKAIKEWRSSICKKCFFALWGWRFENKLHSREKAYCWNL